MTTKVHPPARHFSQPFPATRRGVRLARALAVHQLAVWGHAPGCELSHAAAVVVTEFSANAVLHARVPGRDFGVRLAMPGPAGELRVEVRDACGERRLPVGAPRRPDELSVGGRGLLLVAGLAARWGVTYEEAGKTVWAELR